MLFLTACGGGSESQTDSTAADNEAPVDITGMSVVDALDLEPDDPESTGVDGSGVETDLNAGSGLDSRPSFAENNLPAAGVATGSYRLVNAYPALSFQEALLVADVPGENRMVVVEQTGRVIVFEDQPRVTESREILDISTRIATAGEQGLLGLAFDPEFETNRWVYLNFTRRGSGDTVIMRVVWDEQTDLLDSSTEQIVLTVAQPFDSHNAGMIEFGPDGYLYIALGDGGDGGDPFNFSQNRAELLGSLLRIDVHPADASLSYSIPADNPYVGQSGVREEIFAIGFRNPFRFSFDRVTGDIWLGDVGQERREEVNLVRAGGNYGWRVFEGTLENERSMNLQPDSAFTPPIFEYGHNEGFSIIGGYVYRGSNVPSLVGRYLFTDFFNGRISALTLNGEEVVSRELLGSVEGPTSFGETRDGEVLVVSRYQGIFRIEEESSGEELPSLLSETGLFEDLQSLVPVSGFIAYQPAHPFWSDGALKRRWFGVPDEQFISVVGDDWEFPPGSVSIKHFEMQMIESAPDSVRRLETRVLYHSEQGWSGFSYRWNESQTDARLVVEKETESLLIQLSDGSTRQQTYEYPGQSDCLGCHSRASTFLLGPETRQLNVGFEYPSGLHNQLVTLGSIGIVQSHSSADGAIGTVQTDPFANGAADRLERFYSIEDLSASVAQRARSYLDVNCSHCHQPGGGAPTALDLRYETSDSAMNAIDQAPQNGGLDINDASIVTPGSKEQSILWTRMNRLDDKRMPPLSSHLIDRLGVDVVGEWIDAM